MGAYFRPTALDDALARLRDGGATVLAGGTDFYPARVGRAIDEDVLDITRVAALKGIEEREDHWHLGAAVTWSELIEAPLSGLFDGLKLAAREVGGVQIQNAGTLAGNLCNASPAADGVPALLALDAVVELAGQGGRRTLPLERFILGPRRTALEPGELVVALRVPKPRGAARSHFLKLGARKYLVVSIAMVAATIEVADGRVAAARVAVGACSPVAQRLRTLEMRLAGQPLAAMVEAPCGGDLEVLAPIDDVRGSAFYRRDAALTLVRRVLRELAA